jgi:Cu2+-containing amine oxidase
LLLGAVAGISRTPSLDPLDGDEMGRAAQIVTAAFGKEELIRFERLEIEEPEKAALRTWKPGDAWDRKVRFSIYPAGRIGVTEGILSLGEGRVAAPSDSPADDHARGVSRGRKRGKGAPGLHRRLPATRDREH